MLIETLLKPTKKPQRDVTVFGKNYSFKEIVPGRFVADVGEERAIEALIKTQKYIEFTDQLPESKFGAVSFSASIRSQLPSLAPAPAPVVVPPATTDAPQSNAADNTAETGANGTSEPAVTTETKTDAPASGVDPEKLAAAQSIISVQAKNVGKAALKAEKDVLALALKLEQEAKTPRVSVVETLTDILAKA